MRLVTSIEDFEIEGISLGDSLLDYFTKEEILKKVPSHKTGNIKNIYNAIKFLIESDYVNGSSIKIDGGL